MVDKIERKESQELFCSASAQQLPPTGDRERSFSCAGSPYTGSEHWTLEIQM